MQAPIFETRSRTRGFASGFSSRLEFVFSTDAVAQKVLCGNFIASSDLMINKLVNNDHDLDEIV